MFLQTLAKAIIKGGKVVLPYVLGISAMTPTKKDDAIAARAADTLTQLADLTLYAEVAGQKLKLKGSDQLELISDFVAEIIRKSELMVGKEIVDEAKASAAIKGIAGNIADLMKSVKEK